MYRLSQEQIEFGLGLGEVIDRFLTVQFCTSGGPSVFSNRPVIETLYGAARDLHGEPLTFGAARRLLEALRPGGRVLMTTGFVVPPYLRLETDGPMGVAVLARTLALGLEVNTVVLTEPEGVAGMEQVMAASGLQLAHDVEEVGRVPHKTAVRPFPLDPEEARLAAARWLDEVQPQAVIAVEKPSRNSGGRYHNGGGIDITDVSAKVDALVDEARARGILTIGFGDGGNEIGMGNIASTVRAEVPRGERVAAATETDFLVVSASSTWGAYGAAACLAGMLGRAELLHREDVERRLQEACSRAGFVDPYTGMADGWLDGVPPEVSRALVRLLAFMVEVRLNDWYLQAYRNWARDQAHAETLVAEHSRRVAGA